MTIIYEVEGVPVAWAAPKRRGNIYFNPKHIEQQQVIWQLKSRFNHECISGPLRAHFLFYMPIPKSTSKCRREQMLNGMIHHIGKPDRSNMLKFIEDCLEKAGIISNDSIIIQGNTQKLYGIKPKTLIYLEPLATDGQTYGNML
jgi:Holliday junction resolvase RusA-like endonuclease